METQPLQPKVGVGIPEWCLYAYVEEPLPDDVAGTIQYIKDNPDVARAQTFINDAVFALIIRNREGVRIFTDNDIGTLAKRPREIIDRIINNYLPVSEPVIDEIEQACTKPVINIKGKK